MDPYKKRVIRVFYLHGFALLVYSDHRETIESINSSPHFPVAIVKT